VPAQSGWQRSSQQHGIIQEGVGLHCSTPFIHLSPLSFLSSSYEADADMVMSVIALKPLLRSSNTGMLVEVSKGSTGSLLRGMAEVRVAVIHALTPRLLPFFLIPFHPRLSHHQLRGRCGRGDVSQRPQAPPKGLQQGGGGGSEQGQHRVAAARHGRCAHADVVMSVIALKPLLRGSNTGVVAEVSKGSTGSLLRGMAEVRVSAVENLSAKLFVQCSRQPGLVDVYCKLLDHTGGCGWKYHTGGDIQEWGRGVKGSAVENLSAKLFVQKGHLSTAMENLSAKLFVQCSQQLGLVDVYCKLLDHTGALGMCSQQPGLIDGYCKLLDHTEGMAEVRGTAVENRSAKLFVQCSRQPGLVDVYCKLLDHTGGALRCTLQPSLPPPLSHPRTLLFPLASPLSPAFTVHLLSSPPPPSPPSSTSPLPRLFHVPMHYLSPPLSSSHHYLSPSPLCPSPPPRLAPPDEVINVRSFPSLAGLPYGLVRRGFPEVSHVRRGFPEAVCCGIVRDGKVQFHPKDSEPVQRTDKLMLIALKHTHRHPPPALMMQAAQIRQKQEISRGGREGRGGGSSEGMVRVHRDSALKTRDAGQFKPNEPAARAERMVMLGWRTGVPDMIREFDDYVGPGSELVILAEESLEERERQLARMLRTPLRNLTVVHKVGNPMSRTDLTDAILDPGSVFHPFVSAGGDMFFDNVPFSIIVVSDRSWHHGERTKPDKQSLYSLLLAESVCRANKIKVQSLNAELEDNRLGREVVGSHPSLTYIGTSDLMGLVTSQVTEHAELNAIWTELLNSWGDEIYVKVGVTFESTQKLLNSWGDEIYVKDASLYVSPGETPTFNELAERAVQRGEVAIGYRPGETPTFNELAERAVQRGEVAIGYRCGDTTVINPCPKDVPLEFGPEDSLVLISDATARRVPPSLSSSRAPPPFWSGRRSDSIVPPSHRPPLPSHAPRAVTLSRVTKKGREQKESLVEAVVTLTRRLNLKLLCYPPLPSLTLSRSDSIALTLSRVTKKGREQKESLVEAVRAAVEEYSDVYVFEFDNMRNTKLKELRDELKGVCRFFLGANKVLQVALGRDKATEQREGLHRCSELIEGHRGLLFTSLPKEQVEKRFNELAEPDFARTGSIATSTVELPEGPLTQFSHDMEPFLRKQGMPVRLNRGVIDLVADFTVCTEGQPLSPEAATILRLLGEKMAVFRLHLLARWTDGSFELLPAGVEAAKAGSGKGSKGGFVEGFVEESDEEGSEEDEGEEEEGGGVYDSNDRVRLLMELCESGDLLSLLLSKTKNLNKSVEQQQKPRRRTSESSWPSLKKLSSLCRSRFRNSTGERPTGLPEHLAAGIFWQLVTAVQHCHSQRVVHRDIKLENVLLTSASPASKPSETVTCPFTVKLADFGTATILKPGIDFTMGNVGSAAYKAPEVSQDSYHGTPADVYSLGVVLYALLTSTFPNSGASKGTVTHRNPQDFIDNELTVHLSSGVKQLIAAMLTVDPAKRPTCSQVLEHPWVHTGR
ncbi:unnamed protein product, partial [Closterium sp. NIES-65]